MKVASIVGARPEFVQAAIVSKALRERHDEVLIHTGQHYDDLMSDVFFRELSLPQPDVNLAIGSSHPSLQLAGLIEKIAQVLIDTNPDVVIVRGDTNSTLAGAIAARQNGFALAHIEAGMRSFDRTMPEENNRVVSDHLADLLFTTGASPAEHLRAEGIKDGVYIVGDVMYDTYVHVVREVLPRFTPTVSLPGEYDLLTIHRQGNTDDRERLQRLLGAFGNSNVPALFPVHPRTKARISEWGITVPNCVAMIAPLSYLDMLVAERSARSIFTDSGGVQREAYFAGRPCVTLRDNTEWTETVETGWNTLVGSDPLQIGRYRTTPPMAPSERPSLFGEGDAALKILAVLECPEARAVIDSWASHRTLLTRAVAQ